MQIVKALVLLSSLLGKHAHQIDQEVVDTVADTVAVSFFYLPQELVESLLLASLTWSAVIDIPPTCRQM